MSQHPIRRGFVDVPWGQIHYRQCGNAPGTPLVFLHQTSLSGKSWEPVMELFADQFTTFAPDTPGYGDSTRPAELPSLEWYVDALVAWLDAVGIGRASFLGHHTGCSIATQLAVRYPDRVDKIVLSEPPLFTPEEAERNRGLTSPASMAADGAHLMRTWALQARTNDERLSLELVHADVVESLKAFPYGGWAIKALGAADLTADMRAVRCPVLVIHNPVDPLLRHWERIEAIRPDFRRELVPSKTVDSFIESADITTPLVTSFLKDGA